ELPPLDPPPPPPEPPPEPPPPDPPPLPPPVIPPLLCVFAKIPLRVDPLLLNPVTETISVFVIVISPARPTPAVLASIRAPPVTLRLSLVTRMLPALPVPEVVAVRDARSASWTWPARI